MPNYHFQSIGLKPPSLPAFRPPRGSRVVRRSLTFNDGFFAFLDFAFISLSLLSRWAVALQ